MTSSPLRTFGALWLGLAILAQPVTAPVRDSQTQPVAETSERKAPSHLLFVQNTGQFDPRVRFQMRQGNETWWFTDEGIWLTVLRATERASLALGHAQKTADSESLIHDVSPTRGSAVQGVNLHIRMDSLSPAAHLVPNDPQPAKMNYFRGNDPTRWRSNIPTIGSLVWHDVYPGVDLAFSNTWQVISTHQSPISTLQSLLSNLHLRIDGADRLRVDDAGYLVAETAIGDVALPVLTSADGQLLAATTDGNVVSLSSLSSSRSAFSTPRLSSFTPADDPGDLIYSTYLGGSDTDATQAITVGPDGSAYVTGTSASYDFPTTPGTFDPYCCGVFVSRLSPDGTSLVFRIHPKSRPNAGIMRA